MNYKTILIVDDSATSRMIITRCFEIAGFRESEFIEAEDGIKAIQILSNRSVDLIVTDLKMPNMDGNTLIKTIKENSVIQHIPIMAVSSLNVSILDESPLDIGADFSIQKPLKPEKIIAVLEGVKNG